MKLDVLQLFAVSDTFGPIIREVIIFVLISLLIGSIVLTANVA